jgi:TolA-binding protein
MLMRLFCRRPAGPSILLALLLLNVAGCAYYNTFYLAKKNYREGIKAQDKALTDAPSQEAIAKYDIVIRQCTKVLTEYSKSKYVDDASFLMGAALYGKGDYVNAIKRLAEFSEKYPKSPFLAEARFVEGLARYRRKEYATSDSIFREVDTKYPHMARRWELFYYAGENQSGLKRWESAAYWYARALEAADSRRQKADALRRSADTYLAAGRADTAEVIYGRCLKIEDRGTRRLDVALARAEALRKVGKYPEVLKFLEDWRVFAAQEGREGELLLRVYENMALVGRVQEAIEGYRRLVDKSPRTNVAYEAQFQIGYLYESALQDLEGAGREYDRLKAQPTSEFQTQAARRSQNLATLRQYRMAMASDTTQARAKAAFLLAELYYFQLDKADSALAQYRVVERDFPRSVYAPKSAYARLWITAHDRNDTLAAMALTDSIAGRYRGTRYAESALYLWRRWSGRTDERTALLDSLLASPDTSRMAWFEPEPELKLPALPADTTAANRQALRMAVADSARLDSLRSVAAQLREKHLREMGGKVPRFTPTQPTPPSGTAPPQTSTPQASSVRPGPAPPPEAPDPNSAPQDSTGTSDDEDDEDSGSGS